VQEGPSQLNVRGGQEGGGGAVNYRRKWFKYKFSSEKKRAPTVTAPVT